MTEAFRSYVLRNPGAVERSKIPVVPIQDFCGTVVAAVKSGRRLCALFGTSEQRSGRDVPRPCASLCAVLADDAGGSLRVLCSTPVNSYPSMTPSIPQAHLFEREIYESTGIRPEDHPWLKPVRTKLPDETPFFQEEGAEVHEVAVGPVHAGIIEPGHFRFQCHGETVHYLEIQLGYQHRGAEGTLIGGPNPRSIFIAESIAGDTVIGHALAYCMTLESLSEAEAPEQGEALRAVALELERLSNHIGDLGALANDVGYLPATAYFGRLRGEFLNLLMEFSGNRYGRGLVRPGGAAFDLSSRQADDFANRLRRARADLTSIGDLLFSESSVISRFEETGVVSRQAALDLGLVGPAARACGLDLDIRKDHAHGLYRSRRIPVVKLDSGDVYARAMARLLESQHSLEFLEEILTNLGGGPARAACPSPRRDHLAVALVEGWRGEVCHVAETGSDGRLERYKIYDPSFHNWTGLGLALRGGEISDFPLCNKSFNLSYAGHDL